MADLLEPADGLAANALRRRIWAHQLRMGCLEFAQLVVERVVLVVANFGVIVDVVAARVIGDELAQLGDAVGVIGGLAHGVSSVARSSCRAPRCPGGR